MDDLLDVTAARAFLARSTDPAVALQTALAFDATEPDVQRLRARMGADPRILRLFDRQASDGSWGSAGSGRGRILATLWPAKILCELGFTAEHAGLARALDFLVEHAVIDAGVSVNGRRSGVLPCYTGVLADRLAPALARLAAWRLPDGSWPMLRRCTAANWYQPEQPRRETGSYWITLRMLRLHSTLTRASRTA